MSIWTRAEDCCRVCGRHLGYGIRLLHLGLCESPKCRRKNAQLIKKTQSTKRPA